MIAKRFCLHIHTVWKLLKEQKKNIEIARWRLRSSMFSIFPILSDFLDMKLLKNSDFFEETHVNI